MALFESFFGPDEHDVLAADLLNGSRWNGYRNRPLIQSDCSRHERSRSPASIRIVDFGDDARGSRILVDQGTDKNDLTHSRLRQPSRGDADPLAFLQQRQVARCRGQLYPHAAEIDDDEQFGLKIVSADCGAQLDLSLGDPSRDR